MKEAESIVPVLKLIDHFKREEFTEFILKHLVMSMKLEEWPPHFTIYKQGTHHYNHKHVIMAINFIF
jgi:hypothetical protein